MSQDSPIQQIYLQGQNQEIQSYEQQILAQIQQSQEKDEEAYEELLLDEDQEIELYANNKEISPEQGSNQPKIQSPEQNDYVLEDGQILMSQTNEANPQSPLNTESQPKSADIVQEKDQVTFREFLSKKPQEEDTDLQQQTQRCKNLLQTKYAHFDQEILIRMLYEKVFPDQPPQTQPRKISISKLSPSNKQQPSQSSDYTKRVKHNAKIFVQHGYGINIARQYAQKGEEIAPNPYNNLISKIIKDAWKMVEKQVIKTKKAVKHLSSEQFNHIKTPLVNCRSWMKKQYVQLFNKIILYTHGLKSEKPTSTQFQTFYEYLIPRVKSKKGPSDAKGFKRKQSKKSRKNSSDSNEEFKPIGRPKYAPQRYDELTKIVKDSIKKKTRE